MTHEKQIEEIVDAVDAYIENVDVKHWYRDELDEGLAEALYTAGYRKQAWISVEDRLPDREGAYLVLIVDYLGEERMEVMELFKWANCFDWSAHMSSRWEDRNTITHWMPLPEAPNMKGGAE